MEVLQDLNKQQHHTFGCQTQTPNNFKNLTVKAKF